MLQNNFPDTLSTSINMKNVSNVLQPFLLTVTTVATGFAILQSAPAQAASLVTNGSFEAGLSGWTVVDEAGGSGSWYSQSGSISPTSGSSVAAPPSGTFAAMTDQSGPGSHILFQDIALPATSTDTLTFSYYVRNTVGTFSNPNSMSYATTPNQQFRVDVLDPTSSNFFGASTTGVLANIFQASSNTTGYQALNFDLTPFAGNTIRLAFRETDNQSIFNTGIDNVMINSTASATVPEPFTIIGTLVGGTAAFRMRKKLKASAS